MEEKISSGLKATFLVHAIVGFIFSLIYLLIPERLGQLINWPTQETEVYRLIGAAVLGYSFSSWLAYKVENWQNIKIIVQMEIMWTVLATLVFLYGLIFADLPIFAWVYAAIFAGFAILFTVFYYRK